MDLALLIVVFAVLLLFLIVDMVGNKVNRTIPRHKLTHHRH